MDAKHTILRFASHFIVFILFIGTIIASSVLLNIYGPAEALYADDSWDNSIKLSPPGWDPTEYNIVLDQHSHTLYSDGSLTVRQNIEWHIAMGYNTIIISDHNTLENQEDIANLKAEYAAQGIIIIQGMEWTTHRVHMNIIGLTEWDLNIPVDPTDADIQAVIFEAHRQNATVTVNHYPWSLNQAHMENHPTRDQVLAWGADFIEIVNDDSSIENVYDSESFAFCNSNEEINVITGTDMHRPNGLASGSVHGWTLLNVSEFSEEAIMEELRAGNTEIIYTESGYPDQGQYSPDPAYKLVLPLSSFGSIFIKVYNGSSADWSAIMMYFGYFVVLFAIIEVYRFYTPAFWSKLNAKINAKKKPEA